MNQTNFKSIVHRASSIVHSFKSLTLLLVLMVGVGNVWGGTVSITQSNVTSSGDSKTSYSTEYNIAGWTGKYCVAYQKSPKTYSLQLGYNTSSTKSAYNSHLTTPSLSGGATSITIVTKAHGSNSTASNRTFYLTSSDNLGAVSSYDAKTMYGYGATTEANGSVTISISGAPTQFHIYPNGTAYIESITVTYASGTTVTLNPNYDGASEPYPTVSATNGSAMPTQGVSMPSRTGYAFKGFFENNKDDWGKQYYNADGTSANNWDKSDATASIYAKWDTHTYFLTLDKNDHGVADGEALAEYGNTKLSEVTAVEPVDGYALVGYFTENTNGTKIINADNTLVKNISGWTDVDGKWINDTDPDNGYTLYAQFVQSANVKVFVEVNDEKGGTVKLYNDVPEEVVSGTTFAQGSEASLEATKKDGYRFINWTLSADNGGASLDNPSKTDPTLTIGGKDVTATANFAKEYIITVTQNDADKGEAVFTGTTTQKTMICDEQATINATVLDDENDYFAGWTVNPADGITFADASAATTTITIKNVNATITANFAEKTKATLTLSELGETRTLSGSYVVGDVVDLPSEVVVECQGKQLVGWSTSTVDETDTKPKSGYYEKGAQYTLSAATQTLYAVYAKVTSQPDTWSETALASLTGSDVFVFSDGSYAMTNNNGTSSAPAAASITVENSKITSTVNNNMKWNISGNGTDGYIFYPNGSTTTWLYCNTTADTKSNDNIRVGTGDRKVWKPNNSNYLITNDSYAVRYLSNYQNTDFRGYVNTSNGAFVPKFYKCIPGSSETTKYSTSGPKKVPLTTIQAIQEAATTTEQDVQITFNNWVVTGVIGDVVYISDGTAYGIALDQEESGFVAGNKLSGTVPAQLVKTDGENYPYAKLSGITNTTTGLTVTTGGSVTPLPRTISQLSGATQGVVITLNGVQYSEETDEYTYMYLSESDQSYVQYYNDFAVVDLNDKFTEGNYYNVTGMLSIYEDGRFIAPRSLSDVVEVLATPTNLAVNNITATGLTITWTAVDNATSYDVIVNGGTPISVTTNSKELTELTACTEYTIKVVAKATDYAASQAAQIVESTISDKTITINLTNTQEADGNLYKSGSASVLPCTAAEISLTYSVTDDYDLPETITVTIGGATATADEDYTWNHSTGVVTIPAAKQTGSIVITIESPETTKTYYYLHYNNNGGFGEMDDEKRDSEASEADRTIVLPTCTFTPPTGKEFNFWSLSTTSPSEVTQVTLSQENTVVYAIWKDITYTLESISVKTNPKTAYQDGEALDLSGMVLSASYSASYGAGKTQDVTEGYTSEPANGTVLHESTNVVITYQQKTCTLAVTVSPTFSITYNVELGTLAQGAPTAVAQGGTFTYPNVTVTEAQCLAGYTFAGWTTNGSFAGGASAPSDLKTAGTTKTNVTASIEIYAVYKQTKSTTTDFATFVADKNMTSAPFVIAAKVGTDYYALPNSGYTQSGGAREQKSTIDITSSDVLNSNKITIEKIEKATTYYLKTGSNSYIGKNSNNNLCTTSSAWSIGDGANGSYRIKVGTESRCIAYRKGEQNKFNYYSTQNVTSGSTEYFDMELIPVAISTTKYSIDPDCTEERALELVSSEGTEIRLVEGDTKDSKTTTITAKAGTGSEGTITLSYNGSEYAYVSIDGANVTFMKEGTYLIDANQAATQSYAATTAKITITVNKAFVTLTYDGNGATEGVPAAVTKIEKGASVTLAAGNTMVNTGKAFTKWGSDQSGTIKYAAGASYTISKSTTLYALWQDAPHVNVATVAHGSIKAAPEYALAYQDIQLTLTPDEGYALRPNSIKITKTDGTTVYCSQTNYTFTMPDDDVFVTAEFVKGALYQQARQSSPKAIVCNQTGAYPTDATAIFESSYATKDNSNTVNQIMGNTNMKYTISGYAGNMIKGITLSMHSNQSSGSGTMYVKVGDKTIAQIASATAFSGWFDNTAYQKDFVDIHVTMPKTYVSTGEDVVIYLACSTNSLYCESVFIEWAEITTTRTITGTYGTVCLAKGVEAGNYVGGSFYEGDYLLMDGDRPYKYYLTEVDHLEAGYPYVFVKDQNADAIYVAETGDAVTTAKSKKGLVGTLTQIEPAESNVLTGNYMIVDNLFCECGAYCGLYAYRAYLNISAGDLPREYVEQPAPVGARRLVLTNQAANTPNTPTAIDNLTEDGVKADAAVQKFIIDEKLVIIRGGKMYNASGALVK